MWAQTRHALPAARPQQPPRGARKQGRRSNRDGKLSREIGRAGALVANVPASASFTSRMSAMRLRASFSRHSSSVRRTAGGTPVGSASSFAPTSSTRASVLVTSSPKNAGLPVSIS